MIGANLKSVLGRLALYVTLMFALAYYLYPHLLTKRNWDSYRNNGRIKPPRDTLDHEGPYPPAFHWNLDSDHIPLIRSVTNQIKVHASKHKGATMLTAPEFHVNLMLGYLVPLDLVVLNPRYVTAAGEREFDCTDRLGSEVIHQKRYKEITVAYLDEQFNPQTQTFKGSNACSIQLLLDM